MYYNIQDHIQPVAYVKFCANKVEKLFAIYICL